MAASAPVQYGADPLQFIIPYNSGTTGAPTVIMFAASGFSSGPGLAASIGGNAINLQNAGYCVFIVSYRGSVAPIGTGGYPANQQGGVAAWPMTFEDGVAGSIKALALAQSYGGTSNAIHYVGGSAGGSIAAIVAANMLDLGFVVDSVQTLSMNTDWYTAIPIYYADLNSGAPLQSATDTGHLGNIANALGTFTNSGSGTNSPAAGSLEWHLNGGPGGFNLPNTYRTGAGWGAGYPTGSDIWTRDTFSPYAAAQRCSLKASRCWWQLFNSTDEDIPLDAAFTFLETMSNVGTMATVTVVPGATHGYNLWSASLPSIIQFIRQTSSH